MNDFHIHQRAPGGAPEPTPREAELLLALQQVRALADKWNKDAVDTGFAMSEPAFELLEALEAVDTRPAANTDALLDATHAMLDMLGRDHPYAQPYNGDVFRQRAYERLDRACDIQQPMPVPDQAAIVWRADLMAIIGDLTHKQAFFDSYRNRAPAADAAALADLLTYPSPHGTLVRLADVQCRLAELERNLAGALRALGAENGPTSMGEPVLTKSGPDIAAMVVPESWKLLVAGLINQLDAIYKALGRGEGKQLVVSIGQFRALGTAKRMLRDAGLPTVTVPGGDTPTAKGTGGQEP